jgi:D-inositol-3-phosphate glycosyltransferase
MSQSNSPAQVSASSHPRALSSGCPERQAIALISIHNDPAAEPGKEEASGQSIYVRQIGEALAKLGWQVDLFTRKAHLDDPTIVQHSPHCRTIRLVAGPQDFVPRDHLLQHLPEFVESFKAFQSKDGANYPLIHTNYWLSGWVGLQLKQDRNLQMLHTYHSLGAVKYRAMLYPPAIAETRLATERQILEEANCVVATSPQELETLQALVSGQGSVEVVPCGTDIDPVHTLPKTEARAKLGFAPHEQIVLYVGRFDTRKGIDTLVQAFAQLKGKIGGQPAEGEPAQLQPALSSQARLVFVGGTEIDPADKEERQRIEQLVQELGLTQHTQFVGQVEHHLVPLYYTAADVCVIPSHYEPFGLVAVEAMACGTPVVASDVGGLKFTVIPEETGLLVPPHDVAGFADAIARILNDDLWASQLRRQASLRVQQNFSWTGVAARLSDLYRRLLAQSLTDELVWQALVPEPRDLISAAAQPNRAVTLEGTSKVPADESLVKVS